MPGVLRLTGGYSKSKIRVGVVHNAPATEIYTIGDGVVVFARDWHEGWGNVVIVRHAYREGSVVRNVDSLYGHLEKILVRRGQAVRRGQQVGTMGTAHGLYDSHLHLEVRKNIAIGM